MGPQGLARWAGFETAQNPHPRSCGAHAEKNPAEALWVRAIVIVLIPVVVSFAISSPQPPAGSSWEWLFPRRALRLACNRACHHKF